MKSKFYIFNFLPSGVYALILLMSFDVYSKVAVVKMLRGQATAVFQGKEHNLKIEEWVDQGTVVKTGDKSFVKLVFIDKSSMNIGAKSEMKIESYNGKEAGVIDLVKGQVRSQVSKDYLQIQGQDKSKLFIKTSNAVMGIRGTDFMITTNGKNTSTVLFEGSVVFNSLPQGSSHVAQEKLEEIVNHGVRVRPGEFSVVQGDLPQPTVPSVMNLKQREALEKNVELNSTERSPSSSSHQTTKSVVPAGLSGEAVSNSSENLKKEVASVVVQGPAPASVSSAPVSATQSKGDAAGYVNGDIIKPANGSFVHIESGTIVPPPAGSVLDPNTNAFIPAPGNGSVAADGSFVPPAGVVITPDGKVFVTVTPSEGSQAPKVVEIQKIAPVVSSSSADLKTVVQVINATPSLQNASAPVQASQVASSGVVVQPQVIVQSPSIPAYTSPAQTTYTAAPPTEAQIINAATSGRLDIEVIK